MKIKIKRIDKEIKLPEYSRKGDAALDIRAAESLILKEGERKTVKSGIAIELPEKYVGLVWDRGGLAALNGIHTMAGVLDSNYRGELMIVLINTSDKEFKIEKGDRIAQLLIQPVINTEIEEIENLSESERGENRFSSSGMK